MNVSVINKIKTSPLFFYIYSVIGGGLVAFLRLFVRRDEKLIVFVSFGGKRGDDSPRSIYNAMIADHRFDDYKLVWAFTDPSKHDIPRGSKIKINGLSYIITILKARVWVTNVSMTRGLKFKNKSAFYLNTWHGTPIKKCGADTSQARYLTSLSGYGTDVMLAQGEFEAEKFTRAFSLPRNRFAIIGYPRNDELVAPNVDEQHRQLRRKWDIPDGCRVLLCAPTFRDFERDGAGGAVLLPPINIEAWPSKMNEKYVILFRAHHEVSQSFHIIENQFLRDVSSYPDLNELMILSDVLVSDYSSIIFDYSMMRKPILSFAYDYDEYAAKRGVYIDVRSELDCMHIDTEEKLLDALNNLDTDYRIKVSDNFCHKYLQAFGNASVQSCDLIYQNLQKK